MDNLSVIVISASSDIGAAATKRWRQRGWDVFGTFRTRSGATKDLETLGVELFPCDLTDAASIHSACEALSSASAGWDVLAILPASLNPIGPFLECDITEWTAAIGLNFSRQMMLLHGLLPARRRKLEQGPLVTLFAGPGTNSAPTRYSAHVVAKTALVKACEVLDAEIEDTRFSIVGPGWVACGFA